MFGYVRPRRDELKVWELEAYQGVYCGLCHTMGQRHGFLARMLLNYDFAFLAMLLTQEKDRPTIEKQRCPARLWCKKKGCCAPVQGLEDAADASTILSYWKLRDTVADAPFWKRQGARIVSILLRPAYRRAASYRPDFDRLTQKALADLAVLEGEHSPSLDRPADAFARILRGAAPTVGDALQDRAMGELLYHVGRWIYLLDAWDDLQEDAQSGNYNPILARFPNEGTQCQEEVRITLRHSRNLVASALALLPMGSLQGIVENIVHLGLPSVEEAVFSGRWDAKKYSKEK